MFEFDLNSRFIQIVYDTYLYITVKICYWRLKSRQLAFPMTRSQGLAPTFSRSELELSYFNLWCRDILRQRSLHLEGVPFLLHKLLSRL